MDLVIMIKKNLNFILIYGKWNIRKYIVFMYLLLRETIYFYFTFEV